MAAVQQEPKVGQEPNAGSTPERRRNTRALLAGIALLIVVVLVALAVGSQRPGAGMGGAIGNQETVSGPAPAKTP